jgi:GntR family transcriptional regulator
MPEQQAPDLQANALPLYQQISELLLRDIAAGRLSDGARLPPERYLAQTLGIAVGTLRRALADLEAKGIIDRVQGSGNYVRASALPASIYALFRLELAEGGGGLPTAEILDVARLPKDPGLPAFGTAPDAHRIRRLRRLSGVVAAVEEIWLDASYAETLRREDLLESLYLFYRTRLGLWIQRAEDRVSLAPVPAWAPRAFPHAPGRTAGFIERISLAQDNARAEVSRTWFDHDRVRYVARLS